MNIGGQFEFRSTTRTLTWRCGRIMLGKVKCRGSLAGARPAMPVPGASRVRVPVVAAFAVADRGSGFGPTTLINQ